MNYLKRFFYHTCVYTVVISVLFFLFAKLLNISELSITLGRYFLIIAFGALISCAEFIFEIKKLQVALRYFIHYLSLFVSFFIVFLTVKNSDGASEFKASFIFSALVIFSLIYLLILSAVLIARRVITKNGSKSTTAFLNKTKNTQK